MADYDSVYEGEQMDDAFRRILNMKVGSVEITAQGDGDGFTQFELSEGLAAFHCVCSARCTSINGNVGVINAQLDYTGSTSIAVARISGDGVIYGEHYVFDYLLVE